MKKNLSVLSIFFVGILFLSGCVGEKNAVVNEGQENTKTAEKNVTDNIKDAVMSQKQKCTLTQNGDVVSVIYIDGERVRMDGQGGFIPQEGAQGSQGSMINDGAWVYMWDDVEKKGFKTPVEEDDVMEEDIDVDVEMEESGEYSVEELIAQSQEENVEYSCEKWKVDEAVFIPPTDVEFVDLSQMMQQFDPSALDGQMPEDLSDMPGMPEIPQMP
jgi:hypothetical protein